jgi:16S rRNA (adenine1518-N6/adenine1519-N6)-dimethyltransferase
VSDIDLLKPIEIKELLGLLNIAPQKSRGQNFLVDDHVIKLIVNMYESNDQVVEIGSGLGALTVPLSRRVRRLLAIEIDPAMVSILKSRLESLHITNVVCIEKDVLTIAGKDLPMESFKMFSSMPYYITSPILHRVVNHWSEHLQQGVFLIQKEVAEKIMSKPPKSGYWYHYIHQYFSAEYVIHTVTPASFWPQPGVSSSLIQLVKKKEQAFLQPELFSKHLHTLFTHPRKKLRSFLAMLPIGSEDPILDKRPGELSESEVEMLVGLLMKVPFDHNHHH